MHEFAVFLVATPQRPLWAPYWVTFFVAWPVPRVAPTQNISLAFTLLPFSGSNDALTFASVPVLTFLTRKFLFAGGPPPRGCSPPPMGSPPVSWGVSWCSRGRLLLSRLTGLLTTGWPSSPATSSPAVAGQSGRLFPCLTFDPRIF